ncbi:MAG: SAM-dependent chlorinase/fluorinase [Chloroflexi bacterium]|nr:SAM-dependent chlorinase/fluorinase [Chloroflexota bacterium]MDA1271575.1 SAM-dependent chlorinase/fluorinase [Chloroflexota bacterium]PKB58347.1 MAG: hypothetical protein BZY83_07535 [SAR202 cluster bacterium Casp-Chloro-G2]
MTSPLLVFTTDFGLSDAYAGVMKGVALAINPDLRMIDLTHQIMPQNILHGSFVLGVNNRFFPQDAIHVAVVDPGVGTPRRPVMLSTPWGRYVAPDNGLLSGVMAAYLPSTPVVSNFVKLPPELTAVHLTDTRYWRHPVSQTFHGRDVFTPVASHLSLGVAPEDLGDVIDSLFFLPMPYPAKEGGRIIGEIIFRDTYGNLITNIPAEHFSRGAQVEVRIRSRTINGLSGTFNEVSRGDKGHGSERLIALVGSHGYLEIALPNGNAALLLEAGEGDAVSVTGAAG